MYRLTHITPRLAPMWLACILVVASSLVGCGKTSIQERCDDIAAEQCDQCFECGSPDTDVTGLELCGFERDSAVSVSERRDRCKSRLADRCTHQARSLKDAGDPLETCLDGFAEQSCHDLYGRFALGKSSAPPVCSQFM